MPDNPILMSKDTTQITEPIARPFQGKNFAFVSTLMSDGTPQITPTWVDIDKNGENSILVNTAEGSPDKIRRLHKSRGFNSP